MKRIYRICLVLVLLLPATLQGQNKMLGLEQSILERFSNFYPQNMRGLDWIPGTEKYVFLDEADDAEALIAKDARDKKDSSKEVFLRGPVVNEAALALGFEGMKTISGAHFLDDHTLWWQRGSGVFTYDMEKDAGRLTALPDYAENADVHPASMQVAFTHDGALSVAREGGTDILVAKPEAKDVVYGLAAHRFEFGIVKGTFWSNSGDKLAFYRMNEAPVTDYQIYEFDPMPATSRSVKYPVAGAKSHHATVGVYDINSGKTVYLDSPDEDKEHYYTNITFSPDDSKIYVAELNRDQNHMWLNRYDAATGKFEKTLFEEKENKYVHPQHGLLFFDGRPGEFLWYSRRDGYEHLYRYDLEGNLLGQLTKGPWEVISVEGMSPDGAYLYIISTEGSPIERNLYRVDMKNGSTKRLTEAKGVHGITLNAEQGLYIDNHMSHLVPRVIRISDVKKGDLRTIFTADDPLRDYKKPDLRLFTIKAADGSDLYMRLFLPPNFDENKKYPVVCYVYGGPGIQLILDTFNGAGALWMNYLAQQGYVVYTLENRGTANRGREFEQVTFRNLGKTEVEDQLRAVDWLREQGWADMDHMAVHGWSYGGFMTSNLMLRAPGVFQVGVAGGPVIDWALYEVMYTERYMDTPQTNADGYDESSLLQYIGNLKGKYMIIHGTDDDVVLWQHSLLMVREAVNQGVQMDYFVYPGHPHNVRGKDRAHLMRKVIDYLTDNI